MRINLKYKKLFSKSLSGYASHSYAESLSEFGTPILLVQSGGWILRRRIRGTNDFDAMGVYPILVCNDWDALRFDLENLEQKDLLSVTAVTDPFGNIKEQNLRQCFPDFLIKFKNHFVVDLDRQMSTYVSDHHVRNARRALRELSFEHCKAPEKYLDEWIALYKALVARHSIRGIAAFSRNSFERQLRVPGLVVFRATYQNSVVGMILWYLHGNVGYYHLAAYSDQGYQKKASFGLFWISLEHFSALGVRWVSLGGGAGLSPSKTLDGLSRFKRGWSTETRQVWFCGRILNRDKYLRISAQRASAFNTYFPAYRLGEKQ